MASELPFGEAEQALARLDKLLSEKPAKVGHDFSEAIRHLAMFREGMTFRVREGLDADRPALRRLNGIISAVYAGQFPLGPIPWDTVAKARQAFAELMQEIRAA